MMRLATSSAEETQRAGQEFGGKLIAGDIVALVGTLGSGKTNFAQGICHALGVKAHVSSPTFTLINEYFGSQVEVAHIDLYRLNGAVELADLGLEEYLDGHYVCLIEWPELIRPLLPDSIYTVTISHGTARNEREIVIDGGPA